MVNPFDHFFIQQTHFLTTRLRHAIALFIADAIGREKDGREGTCQNKFVRLAGVLTGDLIGDLARLLQGNQ